MKNSSTFAKIAIIIPVFLMFAWVAQLSLITALGTQLQLKITGYDPRNLLSGHYLRYQVDYGTPLCTGGSAAEREQQCVCFSPTKTNEPAQVTWHGYCPNKPKDCTVYLQGQCDYRTFTAGIERYYFPEIWAQYLNNVPKNATILLNVFQGRGVVENILVGTQPLMEYIKTKQE